MTESLDDLLGVARLAADDACACLLRHFRSGVDVRFKADGTPVTEADEAAERAIRSRITAAFPDHGFYGEEGGAFGLDRPVVWLVDPLDGTKSFVRGTPFFSTQIAALVGGRLAVGVSAAPAWGETCWATAESPAMRDGELIRVSSAERIEEAAISTGNLRSLARSPRGWSALGEVLARAERTRGYGDFCHYHLLAAGQLDAVIEADVNVLDIAALAVIVEAAGGVVTDLDGKAVDLATSSILAAPLTLHAQLLEALDGALAPDS